MWLKVEGGSRGKQPGEVGWKDCNNFKGRCEGSWTCNSRDPPRGWPHNSASQNRWQPAEDGRTECCLSRLVFDEPDAAWRKKRRAPSSMGALSSNDHSQQGPRSNEAFHPDGGKTGLRITSGTQLDTGRSRPIEAGHLLALLPMLPLGRIQPRPHERFVQLSGPFSGCLEFC